MFETNDMTISVFSPSRVSDEYGTLDMSITVSQDATLSQLMTTFERIAMALTYSPTTWRNVIIEKAEVYKHELNQEKHNA